VPGRRRFRASPGVEHPEAPEAARRAALALLARRDHSSAELAAKLTAKGYTPEAWLDGLLQRYGGVDSLLLWVT